MNTERRYLKTDFKQGITTLTSRRAIINRWDRADTDRISPKTLRYLLESRVKNTYVENKRIRRCFTGD